MHDLAVAVASALLMVTLASAESLGRCDVSHLKTPKIFGAEVLFVAAEAVIDYPSSDFSAIIPDMHLVPGNRNSSATDFCNVTVVYTHPGEEDRTMTTVWLPLDGWNQRMVHIGGGGFATRLSFDRPMLEAVSNRYAVVATDGGHDYTLLSSESWALLSPGNVNYYLLQDFAHVSLNEASIIGKAITASFYGSAPKFSYFAGCSTGGRQGLMMAQRYPEAYDGILSGCPAINWPKFLIATLWPYLIMKITNTEIPACVLAEITEAAILACDELDGEVDGIISDYQACSFRPHQIIGRQVTCGDFNVTVSTAAADLVEDIWLGPRSLTGASLWYGFRPGAHLGWVANTTCKSETDCTSSPFFIGEEWLRLFVKKDATYDISKMTLAEYEASFHESQSIYQSVIGTDDPNLSGFKQSGAKIIAWHGSLDQVIPPGGSNDYYDRVITVDPDAHEYFRYFEIPGVQHCDGGPGPVPTTAFESLLNWVERGIVPDTLSGNIFDKTTDRMIKRNTQAYHILKQGKHHNGDSEWTRKTEL